MSDKVPKYLIDFYLDHSPEKASDSLENIEAFFLSDDFFSLCKNKTFPLIDQLTLYSQYLHFFHYKVKIPNNISAFLLKLLFFWLKSIKTCENPNIFRSLLIEFYDFLIETRQSFDFALETNENPIKFEYQLLRISRKLSGILNNIENLTVNIELFRENLEKTGLFHCFHFIYAGMKLKNFEGFWIFHDFYLKNPKSLEKRLLEETKDQLDLMEIFKISNKVCFFSLKA